MKEQGTENIFGTIAGYSIGISIVMIILGTAAIVLPMWTGIAVSVMFGWIILIGGFTYFIYAFSAGGVGGFLWRLLISVVYFIGGGYLLAHPVSTLEGLTFALAVIILVEGVFQIIGFFTVRELPGSGWLLFDGVISIVLGAMIAYNWPATSSWAIGTLVGANLLVSGFSRLFYSVAAKGAVSAVAH
ncbi:MAG: DUF308 domain-containing protein [Acidobacteria bacterium]|nr:DUF308 domain-containing protein [Acidobacteriota bacterium]